MLDEEYKLSLYTESANNAVNYIQFLADKNLIHFSKEKAKIIKQDLKNPDFSKLDVGELIETART